MAIINQSSSSKIKVTEIENIKNNQFFEGVVLVKGQLYDLSLSTLQKCYLIKNSIIILIEPQSSASLYLIDHLYGWYKLKFSPVFIKNPSYLPKNIFNKLPNLDKNIRVITSLKSLVQYSEYRETALFTNINFSSSCQKFKIYFPSDNPLKYFFSICSIKKIMQYIMLRTYKDLPE